MEVQAGQIIQVAVDAPLPQPLTYSIPSDLQGVQVGSHVEVPLGSRSAQGVVVSFFDSKKEDLKKIKIKPIKKVLYDITLDEKNLNWLKWMAQYYVYPIGRVLSLACAPGSEKRKRKATKKGPIDLDIQRDKPFDPMPDQKSAITQITEAVRKNAYEPFLLFGVTGSGKTEVYLQSIDEVTRLGKQALVLVPEISLTPQLIQRFVSRFGENVAVLHSHLTDRERADQWWSAVKGEKKILVGARSALFCPLKDLGLIVIDEEHDGSFKQDEQLKYHARDAAIMKARLFQCPIVLGSATPSLESWQNVISKKFALLELSSRVENRQLPIVEIVDIKEKKPSPESGLPYWLTLPLYDQLREALKNKKQAALFLNRRGFGQFTLCSGCGYTVPCPNCSITLTVHNRGQLLSCHYCGYHQPLPQECPSCKQHALKSIGLGTEKICDDLALVFPEARIVRADRDEIKSREDLERFIESVHSGNVDIVVGTQMIAKGHDFPNLNVVGILLADLGLHFPDFRSSERTFQLLTQVAGRAGRHGDRGHVVIQTYTPEHPAIQMASKQDFKSFANFELKMREELKYPPFGRLAILRLQGANQKKVEEASALALRRLEFLKTQRPDFAQMMFLGPCESALFKLKNKYRYQILIKALSSTQLNILLQFFANNLEWLATGVSVSVDMDPVQLL